MKLRIALLILLHSNITAIADEGFILQPKLRHATAKLGQSPAEQAPGQETHQRSVGAAMVSIESRRELSAASVASLRTPFSDSAVDWQAVGERLAGHLQDCQTQLGHSMFSCAREEAELAALTLVCALDQQSQRHASETQWLAAQQALNEVEVLLFAQRLPYDSHFLARVIASHQTQVLKGMAVHQLSPSSAAQHYLEFATQNLILAGRAHPWASEVYYSIGRSLQAQADASPTSSDALRWKAITYYRAAAAIAPQNPIPSNQLGFNLLQVDRASDARAALLHSLGVELSKPALENLVEASRRLGDAQTRSWALHQLSALRSPVPPQAPTVPSQASALPVTLSEPQALLAQGPYTTERVLASTSQSKPRTAAASTPAVQR